MHRPINLDRGGYSSTLGFVVVSIQCFQYSGDCKGLFPHRQFAILPACHKCKAADCQVNVRIIAAPLESGNASPIENYKIISAHSLN